MFVYLAHALKNGVLILVEREIAFVSGILQFFLQLIFFYQKLIKIFFSIKFGFYFLLVVKITSVNLRIDLYSSKNHVFI